MKFSCQVVINKPLTEVVKAFHNPDNLVHWQDGFISYKHLGGTPGAVGAKALMVYDIRGKELNLYETILINDFPHHFVGKYECEPMTNTMSSRFDSTDDNQTIYTADIEYMKLNGFIVKIMAALFPAMMKKQTQKWLYNFKNWMEAD